MKLFLKCTLSTFLIASNSGLAQKHDHPSHQQHHPEKKETNNKKAQTEKFKADEALRSRMKKIAALSSGTLQPATGSKIIEVVQDIFKNCKLDPKADEAIHPILAEIISAAKTLEKGDVKLAQSKIQEKLNEYERNFE